MAKRDENKWRALRLVRTRKVTKCSGSGKRSQAVTLPSKCVQRNAQNEHIVLLFSEALSQPLNEPVSEPHNQSLTRPLLTFVLMRTSRLKGNDPKRPRCQANVFKVMLKMNVLFLSYSKCNAGLNSSPNLLHSCCARYGLNLCIRLGGAELGAQL